MAYYIAPMVAVEGEAFYGLALAQAVNYPNKEVFHVQVPKTLQTSGNVVIFPGRSRREPVGAGGSRRQLAGYVTGSAGMFTLISRNSTKQFGLTEAESFVAANVV